MSALRRNSAASGVGAAEDGVSGGGVNVVPLAAAGYSRFNDDDDGGGGGTD